MKNNDSFFRESSMVWTPWLKIRCLYDDFLIITTSYYLKELATSSGLRDYVEIILLLLEIKNARTLRVNCMCLSCNFPRTMSWYLQGREDGLGKGILDISHAKYPKISQLMMCKLLNHEFTSQFLLSFSTSFYKSLSASGVVKII